MHEPSSVVADALKLLAVRSVQPGVETDTHPFHGTTANIISEATTTTWRFT